MPKPKEPVEFKVHGKVDGKDGATLTVDPERELVRVRPKRAVREYVLPSAYVCEMVVSRVVKDEMGDKARAIAPRRLR